MLSDVIKQFFKNEWKGLKQTWLVRQFCISKSEKINEQPLTSERYPVHQKIAKEISDKTNVNPSNIVLTGNIDSTIGLAYFKERKIVLGRGLLVDDKRFVGTYAHELGHIKHSKLHSQLGGTYFKIPYMLLFSATSNLYAIGGAAYTFLGNNKILESANWLFSHTGKYLAGAIIANTIMTRINEHMADLFAYNNTGLLPSAFLSDSRNNGILGKILDSPIEIILRVTEGYPTKTERDIVCKILGKKPIGMSFVEKLKSEREKLTEKADGKTL